MISLEKLRVRAGYPVADTTHDVALSVGINTAIALAEKYCNRRFMHANDTEVFTHVHGPAFQLHRLPILNVLAHGSATPTHVDKEAGVVYFDGYNDQHQITIVYEGGYTDFTLPQDLELALLTIFDNTYAATSGAGGATTAAGAIESVTLADVGTVRFATGDAAAAASSAGAMGGLIPAMATGILDLYRIPEA